LDQLVSILQFGYALCSLIDSLLYFHIGLDFKLSSFANCSRSFDFWL